MNYRLVKRIVLVSLLAVLCFGFGYLVFKTKLQGSSNNPEAGNGEPPAPVMQQLQALKARIAENPKDQKAYTELGNLYFQAGKFAQALAYYEKAVHLDPKDIIARNDLALCYHIAKREKEAFQQLNAAIKLSPRSQHLWLTLGLVNYETGQLEEARRILKKAVLIDPHSEAGRGAKSMLSALEKRS